MGVLGGFAGICHKKPKTMHPSEKLDVGTVW